MAELLTSQAAISIENSRLVKEMRRAEGQIKKSLREKEALLKEVHHRVKNNLQIIQSMLNLQMPHIKDAQAIEFFKEGQNRVYTMALIHEKLYRSESLAKIDLSEYIRSLIANLFLSYGVSERAIRPYITVEEIALNVDTVIPCALIINELVSNSLKHAFPDSLKQQDGTGEIRIDLHRYTSRASSEGMTGYTFAGVPAMSNHFMLTVSDNGVGLPDSLDIGNSESLGLKLVNILVKQLRGTIQINTVGRTEFAIRFQGSK